MKYVIASMLVLGLVGCATTSSVEKAQATADRAEAKAQAAAELSAATSAKLDAMFKKSMMK